MSIQVIGFITVALGLLAVLLKDRFAIAVLIPFMLLGGAGAILLSGSGTIQPAHLLLIIIASKKVTDADFVRRTATSSRFGTSGYWLILFVSYALLSAYVMPRMFAGDTQIFAIGATDYGLAIMTVPLGPTGGNITQSAYIFADALCYFVILTFCKSSNRIIFVAKTLCVYAVCNIVFAILDVVTFWTGTAWTLDFIRNAAYAFHLDEASGDLKRIAGSFTETSSFAYATVGIVGFTFRLWVGGWKPKLTGTIFAISCFLLMISTSTTAIVSIFTLLCFFYCIALWNNFTLKGNIYSTLFCMYMPVLASAAVAAVILVPNYQRGIYEYLDSALFSKSSSNSGLERASWNASALQNFLDTFGLGTGLGSVRASSFALALLSNLGIAGTLFFLMFFITILIRTPKDQEDAVLCINKAAKTALISLLIAACVSGALVDLGLPFFVFCALGAAAVTPRQVP